MYKIEYNKKLYIFKNKNNKNIDKIINFLVNPEEMEKQKENPDFEIRYKNTLDSFKHATKTIKEYNLYNFLNKKYLWIKGKTTERGNCNFDYNIKNVRFIDCNIYDLINKNITKKFYDIIKNNQYLQIELQNQVSYSQPFGRVTTKKQLYYIDSIDTEKKILQLYFTDNPGFKSFLNLKYDKILLKNNKIVLYNDFNISQYEIIFADSNIIQQLKKIIKNKRGNISKKIIKVNPENKKEVKTAQKTSKKTIKKAVSFNINDLNKIKKQIEKDQNIKNIEILGAWIWCETLDTTARDLLLNIGFKFSFSKLKFYYHNKPFKKRSNKTLSYERIKELYKKEVS